MPAHLKEVLYTAEAVVEGGREGHGRTSDGRLDIKLSVTAAMSGDCLVRREQQWQPVVVLDPGRANRAPALAAAPRVRL